MLLRYTICERLAFRTVNLLYFFAKKLLINFFIFNIYYLKLNLALANLCQNLWYGRKKKLPSKFKRSTEVIWWDASQKYKSCENGSAISEKKIKILYSVLSNSGTRQRQIRSIKKLLRQPQSVIWVWKQTANQSQISFLNISKLIN